MSRGGALEYNAAGLAVAEGVSMVILLWSLTRSCHYFWSGDA